MSFLDIALRNAARGFRVMPVNGKDAILKDWPNVATTDETWIREWAVKFPGHNVGVAAGDPNPHATFSVAIVDSDRVSRLKELSSEQAAEWFDTYSVTSGRPDRAHFYYLMTDEVHNYGNKKWAEPGIEGNVFELKVLGGQVVAEGSVHPITGDVYKATDRPLIPFPAGLLALMRECRGKNDGPRERVPREKICEGGRHDALVTEAGRVLRVTEMSKPVLTAHLLDFNEQWLNPPLTEEEVHSVALSCNWQPEPPPPQVTIGGSKRKEAESAEVAEKTPRPVFPDESWAGTIYGEFAEIVCRGNFIRKRLASEAFRAITGAIAGEQVTCGIAGVRLRDYFAVIANRQSGKSYAMDCATWFYTRNSTRHVFEPMLMLHSGRNNYRTSGIGAQRFLPGSANSFVDELTRDSKPKSKKEIQKEIDENGGEVSPPLMWMPTARLITIQGEAMALFSRLCSPDWTGQALSALVTDLYDGMDAEVAVTANRAVPGVPVQLQYSMLLCTQPLIWRKYMASHMMDSGLFGRFYIVGSEYKPTKVSLPDYADLDLFHDHFGALRRDVFSRLDYLSDHPLRMTIAPEAKRRLQDWENELPDDDDLDRDLSSRLGLHVMRAAMARAWGAIPQRTEMTVEDADAAILLGEYQIKMRQYYAPTPGDSPRWKHLNAVKAAIELAGQITVRDLRRDVRGDRFPEDFDWALKYLEGRGTIVTRKVGRSPTACWVTGTDV